LQTCQHQALRDLGQAFDNFFTKRVGYLRFRCKGVNDSFRFQGREVEVEGLNSRWGEVWLPKIGWLKYRGTRPPEGTIENVTVLCAAFLGCGTVTPLDPLGCHVSFCCKIERAAAANILPAVGIYRGVANALVLSNGEVLSMPTNALIPSISACTPLRRCWHGARGSTRRRHQL